MKKENKKGLVVVFTGDGKGKTTSALGMALRASGHGKKILIIQFIKNYKNYGELKFVKKFPRINIKIKTFGEGYVGIRGDKKPREVHSQAAQKAFDYAQEAIKSRKYFMIILDEINIALNLKLLKVDDVLKLIKSKPENLHLVLTGRGAPKKIIQTADLVTEMKEIKHPYRKGILAQKGIEF
ncbi:MAG: cob(I)yrinic acid a,c-diamide adenosyltransferase [Candidatus Zixiibacteriota bacterium]